MRRNCAASLQSASWAADSQYFDIYNADASRGVVAAQFDSCCCTFRYLVSSLSNDTKILERVDNEAKMQKVGFWRKEWGLDFVSCSLQVQTDRNVRHF